MTRRAPLLVSSAVLAALLALAAAVAFAVPRGAAGELAAEPVETLAPSDPSPEPEAPPLALAPSVPLDELVPPAKPVAWSTGAEEAPDPPEDEPAPPPAPTYDLAAIQRQLTELRYYVGTVDGNLGAATRSAIQAFQKVHGLAADGAVGPATLAALEAPRQPQLRGGPATRVEVDLTKQVLYLVQDGTLTRILPISSGGGHTYLDPATGRQAKALTPVGTYRVERRIHGERHAPLGILYDPLYFYKGWAIHGSNSVPAGPASSGCIRVTRWDMPWLFARVPNGTPVILYGGVHTFEAGSSAPGTDEPAGDPVGPAPAPSPAPSPTPSPSPSPTPSPTPTPSPSPSPTPTPSPSPSPSPTPSPTPTDPPSDEPGPGDPAPPDGDGG
jgi:lipoprotein-anchoring transpeptidase ErfK/SrfK